MGLLLGESEGLMDDCRDVFIVPFRAVKQKHLGCGLGFRVHASGCSAVFFWDEALPDDVQMLTAVAGRIDISCEVFAARFAGTVRTQSPSGGALQQIDHGPQNRKLVHRCSALIGTFQQRSKTSKKLNINRGLARPQGKLLAPNRSTLLAALESVGRDAISINMP